MISSFGLLERVYTVTELWVLGSPLELAFGSFQDSIDDCKVCVFSLR